MLSARMLRTYEPSGRVSPLAALTFPLAISLLVGLAYPYQWVLFHISLRKLLIFWVIGGMVCVGLAVLLAARFGKVRGIGWGILLGTLAGAAYEGATFWTLFVMDPDGQRAGRGLMEYLSFRRTQGYHWNQSGSSVISGALLLACWAVESVLMLLAGLIGGAMGGAGPFCESCGRWANKDLWRFDVRGLADAVGTSIKNAQSFDALMNVPAAGGGGAMGLRYAVQGCPCGQTATVTVSSVTPGDDDNDTTQLVSDVLVGAKDLAKLFTWAERRDPAMVEKRPRLDMQPVSLADAPDVESAAATSVPTPLVRDLEKLPTGDPRSFDRLGGDHGSSSSMNEDNSFTRQLRDRLRAGDFTAAKEALRGHRDANDLAFVAEACASWSGEPPRFLAAWERAEPDSAALHLIQGLHGIKWAWKARGASWKPKDYPEFQRRLEAAEAQLSRAAAKVSRDPTAWSGLIHVARGRSRPSDGHRAFERVLERTPDHYPAHEAMLFLLMSKWHGSTEKMFDFARRTAAGARPGSVLPALLVDAHLEQSHEVWREKGKSAGKGYWKEPSVRDEVHSACLKVFAPGAHKVAMLTPMARAKFAWALWMCGDHRAAAEQMQIIGPETPWGPFTPALLPWGLMPGSYKAARRQCGA